MLLRLLLIALISVQKDALIGVKLLVFVIRAVIIIVCLIIQSLPNIINIYYHN